MDNNRSETRGGRVRVLVVSNTATADNKHWDDAWNIAAALAREHDVILALPAATSHTHPDFAVIYYNRRNLGMVAMDSEAVVCGGDIVAVNDFFEGGSIIPADLVRLKMGVLGGAEAVAPGDVESGSGIYYIWMPPEKEPGGAPADHLKRLRYYMHKGGIRYTGARAVASLKRRLGFGK